MDSPAQAARVARRAAMADSSIRPRQKWLSHFSLPPPPPTELMDVSALSTASTLRSRAPTRHTHSAHTFLSFYFLSPPAPPPPHAYYDRMCARLMSGQA